MERMNSESHLDLLRRTNALLEDFFTQSSGAAVRGTEQEIQTLLQLEYALLRVGAVLDRGLQHSEDPATQDELTRYRTNLMRLRHKLPIMQESAAGCRARLFARQNHLQAARAWCAATRTTGA